MISPETGDVQRIILNWLQLGAFLRRLPLSFLYQVMPIIQQFCGSQWTINVVLFSLICLRIELRPAVRDMLLKLLIALELARYKWCLCLLKWRDNADKGFFVVSILLSIQEIRIDPLKWRNQSHSCRINQFAAKYDSTRKMIKIHKLCFRSSCHTLNIRSSRV